MPIPSVTESFSQSFADHRNLIDNAAANTLWYMPHSRDAIDTMLIAGDMEGAAERIDIGQLTQTPNADNAQFIGEAIHNIAGQYQYIAWKFSNPGKQSALTRDIGMSDLNKPRHPKPWPKAQQLHTLSLCGLYAKFAANQPQLVEVANAIAAWSRAKPPQPELVARFRDALGAVVLRSFTVDDYAPPLPDQFISALQDIKKTPWGQFVSPTLRTVAEYTIVRRSYSGLRVKQMAAVPVATAVNAQNVFNAMHLTSS